MTHWSCLRNYKTWLLRWSWDRTLVFFKYVRSRISDGYRKTWSLMTIVVCSDPMNEWVLKFNIHLKKFSVVHLYSPKHFYLNPSLDDRCPNSSTTPQQAANHSLRCPSERSPPAPPPPPASRVSVSRTRSSWDSLQFSPRSRAEKATKDPHLSVRRLYKQNPDYIGRVPHLSFHCILWSSLKLSHIPSRNMSFDRPWCGLQEHTLLVPLDLTPQHP